MAFGAFKVLAGDFTVGEGHQLVGGKLEMNAPGKMFRESIPLAQVQSVEIVSQESGRASVGGAVVGAALFGVVGAVVGASAGSGGEVTFTCTLRDRRAFMATAPVGVYNEIMAATFRGGIGMTAPTAPGFSNATGAKTARSTWFVLALIIVLAAACFVSRLR